LVETSFGIAAPFSGLPRLLQASLFAALLIATILLGRYLLELGKLSDQRLHPFGVLAIEAPGSPANARQFVERLGADGVESVRRQTRFDFAFLVAYALTLSLACGLIADGFAGGPMKAYGIMIAWAALMAGALDAVENVAMLQMLGGSFQTPWPQLATVCASLKFSIAFGAVFYILAGGAALAFKWMGSR